MNLIFEDLNSDGTLVDLSRFSTATIKIRCVPRNELSFILHLYEDKITKLDDINSFRKVSSFFTCDEVWQEIRVSLDRLVTPEWWLQSRGLNLSNQQYSLTKVKGISLTNTTQTPRNKKISVFVGSVTMQGLQISWVIVGCLSLFILCAFMIMVYLQRPLFETQSHALKVKSTPQESPPPQQLNIQSKREREADLLIAFLLSNYSNTHISLEHTADALGINRTKINLILKEATGQTFSVYLNKLRLTEASRLLKEKQITVSEAAFAVGFGSISYFNRVFKKEFGCPPSQFRDNDESTT